MTTYPAFRTGYRSAPAPAVSDAAPTARPGEIALGDGRRRVGASGPRDATAAVSVPQPGVAEHRAEVRPSHSHTVGKRSAGGGSGGDSLLGSAAGTAALVPVRPGSSVMHGTSSGYTYGCRCADCREARQVQKQAWAARNFSKIQAYTRKRATGHARGTTKTAHGTRSRFNAGCRCTDCTEANRLYIRAYKARLAALPGARPVQAGNQGRGDTGSGTAATGHTAG